MSKPWYEKPVVYTLVFGVCLAAGLLPLWSTQHEPGVDFPQHLFLIHVLQSVNDPGSFYSADFVAKPGLTYVSFYYSVRAFAALFGVETGLKLWLSLVLGGIPLSLALLLRALGRSPWLALLAVPLLYTDNFYWGLISFLSSLPFTFLTMAFFVMVLQEKESKKSTLALLAGSLVLLQLTHAAGIIFPAIALPLLLLTTPSDWRRRGRAVLGVVPGVALFLAWLLAGVNQGRKIGRADEQWTAHAPLFDVRAYVFTPISQKYGQLWDLLANGFWAWGDRPPLKAWAALLVLVVAASVVGWLVAFVQRPRLPPLAELRPLLMLGLALACFFFLPMDIPGYMYQLYPRYSQVAALLVLLVPTFPDAWTTQLFIPAATAVAVYFSVITTPLFRAFDAEAEAFETVAKQIEPHSQIMHLVLDQNSRVSTHSVYLHYAALAAMRRDGEPSFSLARDPSFPVGYKHGLPRAPPWEWRPAPFSWDEQGRHYDYFLIRERAPPQRIVQGLFGQHAGDVDVVAHVGEWTLVHKRGGADP